MLEIFFEGYFQLRMATDPDPTDDPRGLSGYTFALPGEPDFDGVLHFQPDEPGAWQRQYGPTPASPGPRIGVRVTQATYGGAPFPVLVGSLIRMPGARLVERNGLVIRNDYFAMDPVRVQLELSGATVLDRTDLLDPNDPTRTIWHATTPMLLRRQPTAMQRNSAEVAAATGLPNADDTTLIDDRRARHAALVAWLAEVGTSNPVLAAGLETRISELEILRQWWNLSQDQQPIDRRAYTLALQFTGWNIPVTGPVHQNGVSGDPTKPWPLSFWLGGWDGDGLTGYIRGQWQVPVTSTSLPTLPQAR